MSHRLDTLTRPVEEYLAHRLGREVEIVSASRFPRGSSRVTWFVDYRGEPGAPVTKLVFRGDHPSGSTIPTSLEQEYYIYERLGHTAVPVAKVLWWEDDPYWAVRPFYVRAHVEGDWNVPHFYDPDPRYDALRIEISKEHLRKLVLVHEVDWRALGLHERLLTPRDEADAAPAYLREIERQLAEFGAEPVPLFAEAAAWLAARAPVAPRLSLCKGTNGLGEEVFLGRTIVAMSDWEEAVIGDPAADLAFIQQLIPDIERDGRVLWGLDHAVAYYNEVSGIGVTREAVEFYRLLQPLKMLMYCQKAGMAARTMAEADIRQPWTGTEVMHVAKLLLASSMGLLPPLPRARFSELNESVE